MAMGIVMFVLGLAVPLLIREPAKGRYTPANKVRAERSWTFATLTETCQSLHTPLQLAEVHVYERTRGLLLCRAGKRYIHGMPRLSRSCMHACCDSWTKVQACAVQAAEAGDRFRVWPAVRYLMIMRTFWLLTLATGAPRVLSYSKSTYA